MCMFFGPELAAGGWNSVWIPHRINPTWACCPACTDAQYGKGRINAPAGRICARRRLVDERLAPPASSATAHARAFTRRRPYLWQPRRFSRRR
jgi:hypothetical protein